MQRRSFIKVGGAALGGAVLTGTGCRAAAAPVRPAGRTPGRAPELKKAVKLEMVAGDRPLVEKFRLLKELGYDGVELSAPNAYPQAEVLRARDAADLPIHGVVDSVHWEKTLSHPDPKVRAEGLAGLQAALRDAKAYGATTVLLVPAVVNAEVPYDDAYRRSQAEVRKALPLAEDLGIRIAFENVWNHFLLSPREAAQYVDEFESPFVGWYFDVGNIVNYGWPEHWIRILGDRILKLDIKEFSRELRDEQGLWKGFEAEIGDGSVDWPKVRAALAEIGFNGWATAEVRGGDRERLQEIARRMDRHVLAKA